MFLKSTFFHRNGALFARDLGVIFVHVTGQFRARDRLGAGFTENDVPVAVNFVHHEIRGRDIPLAAIRAVQSINE